MSETIHIPNARDGYVDLVRHVHRFGDQVSPRGLMTFEIQAATVVLNDPRDALPIGVGRGVSTGIAAVESCQLLAGVSTPELVVAIGPIFENYREDNGEFHGAYGPRTRGQFEVALERLKHDADTRQAVVTIWDKNLDLMENKRDYPCTLAFTFHLRKNRLDMLTKMRSNDVMKGVGYDYWQFTRVQLAMASVLGVEPGRYYHYADSLHLYESDLPAVGKLHYADGPLAEQLPAITGATWREVAMNAHAALTIADRTRRGLPSPQSSDKAVTWSANAMIDAMTRNEARRGR